MLNDLTGKVFGRLTVIHRSETVNGKTMWMDVCRTPREESEAEVSEELPLSAKVARDVMGWHLYQPKPNQDLDELMKEFPCAVIYVGVEAVTVFRHQSSFGAPWSPDTDWNQLAEMLAAVEAKGNNWTLSSRVVDGRRYFVCEIQDRDQPALGEAVESPSIPLAACLACLKAVQS